MSHTLTVEKGLAKDERYRSLIPQIIHLLEGESDLTANLANTVSVLHNLLEDVIWTGFYIVKGNELVLGPFQGKPACTRLVIGKGVCGTSAERMETVVVEDVHKFEGHIFCDPDSRAEIVVPVIKDGKTIAVLDIDSSTPGRFDSTDKEYLENLIEKINYIFG